jgi:short-subunit dehydrogenase
MPRRNIQDACVVVTGASSGIGRELAHQFCAHGARVIAVARRQPLLEQLADECNRENGELHYLAGDVTDTSFRRHVIATVRERFGRLDMLVNNAGVGALGAFADADEARLRQVMEVNFFAAAEWTRDALPLLGQGRKPLVVNIGSILGHRGVPSSSEYCASKFALCGFSESLRAELEPQGIGVLHVSPGPTETDFFDHVVDRKGEMAWRKRPKTPAPVVARRIVRAVIRGRREIIPSATGWLFCFANRLVPSIVDWAIRRTG